MNTNDMFDSFNSDQMKKYQKEAKQRWGDTVAYKQSIERTKNFSKEDWVKVKEEQTCITNTYGTLMGKDIHSKEVQDVVEKHYKFIGKFYKLSKEMFKNLGQMYVDDQRFSTYYDGVKPGLAVFVRDAIEVFCN